MSSADSAPLTVVDLLVFIYTVSQAWYVTPVGLLKADGFDPHDPGRIAAHRRSVVSAVARIVLSDSQRAAPEPA